MICFYALYDPTHTVGINTIRRNSLIRSRAMRTIEVSDELFEQLKGFVVDPFDDTSEAVIARLVNIVNKAKNRWSPLEANSPDPQAQTSNQPQGQVQEESEPGQQEEEPVVML